MVISQYRGRKRGHCELQNAIHNGRVAPGIAPWRSHRSGLAPLRHPVRQRTDWQRGRDTSAEAGRAPLMLSNGVTVTATRATKCSPWFPPLGPPVGSTLPSTGSSEASSPASTVLRRCATSCVPLAGLGCLRPAIPCVAPVVSLPAVQDAQPQAWGAIFRSPLPDRSAGRQAGPPTFLGNPDCFYARFFDSGRTARPHYHDGAAARPPLREPRGLLRRDFRSSIAWP
jgi:hypothetical protein